VFIFSGSALLLGSPTALIATLLHLPLVDQLIRHAERQLQRRFGDEWRRYTARVRWWVVRPWTIGRLGTRPAEPSRPRAWDEA
jgi:protein-S-isoprenylcysteine O-methyltransferase Ste14